MAIPKHPRQAMINMMYLVLTAMLALNISAEVLQAFKKVDESIQKSITAVQFSSDLTMRALQLRADNDPKAMPFLEKAQQAHALADTLYWEVEALKRELRLESGVKTNSKGDTILRNERDTHTPTYLLINEGKGTDLKNKINSSRETFLGFFDAEDRDEMRESVPLAAIDPEPTDEVSKTWEETQFEEMPIVAALVMLSKIQNDVRTTEAQVVKYMMDKAGMVGYDFDQVVAQAIPQARWVTVGDQMRVDLMVAAYDSKVKSEVLIGPLDMNQITVTSDGALKVKDEHQEHPPLLSITDRLEPNDKGIAEWIESPSAAGQRHLSGVIKVVDQDNGEISWFPFKTEYQVIRPAAVVSPDYMNVLYIGVDNPMSISVPGFTDGKVSATITNGTLTRSGSGYIARVTDPGSIWVNVSARTENGVRPMGRSEFKVKLLPTPAVTMGPYGEGCVPLGAFRGLPGLTAQAPWFYFPVNYRIESFNVSILKRDRQYVGPIPVTGPLFSQQVKDNFANLKVGEKVWIEEIVVVPPDGRRRKVNLSFKVCN
jgi:gliding motility-associated protein GldM